MTYKGIVRGDFIELEGGAKLPDGTEVVVVLVEPSGSPLSLQAALATPSQCTAEDVAELSTAIEQGKKPVRFAGPFEPTGQSA